MTADAKESAFQRDILSQMLLGGWVLGSPERYDRDNALYSEDCLAFVKATQFKMWERYRQLYPSDPEGAFLGKLAAQLNKADPQASDRHLRTFGTLGVLRHELRNKSCSFKLCQFKPENTLTPDALDMYGANILRVLPELVYSPYATEAHLKETGSKAKAWRIDLVLFVYYDAAPRAGGRDRQPGCGDPFPRTSPEPAGRRLVHSPGGGSPALGPSRQGFLPSPEVLPQDSQVLGIIGVWRATPSPLNELCL